MNRTLQRLTVAALAISTALVENAHAQAGAAGRRDGHQVIRMNVASEAHMRVILALGAEPLNCVIGPGQQDFCASPRTIAQLRAMGMRHQMLHADMQALIDAELAHMHGHAHGGAAHDDGALAGVPGGAWFDDFKTYPQIDAYIDTLIALRPDLASRFVIGTTIEGRPMHAMRISSAAGGPNKPGVLITAGQHAREWAAVMTAMYAADALVRGADNDARIAALLDRVEFFIVPVVNADGFEFTYAVGGDRLWRKNRRDHPNDDFGVDLNRNWGVDWGGPNSTSSSTSSDVYYGAAAFSEPETDAIRDFVEAHPNLVASLDVHSFGQLILQAWNYAYDENPDYDVINAVGTAMNQAITAVNNQFYSNGWGGSLLYLASGVMPDWMYGERDLLAYTIEVRDMGATGFILPAAQIIPTGAENFPAMLTLAERAAGANAAGGGGGAEFFFPNGLPQAVNHSSAANVRVDIRPPTPLTTLNSATAKLWWRVGSTSAFTSTPLSFLSGVQYQATLPAIACGQKLEFYFEIRNSANNPVYSPANAPASVHSAVASRQALHYNFDTAAGWTTTVSGATAGLWARGVPLNQALWAYDPRADAEGGTGQCWMTGNSLGPTDLDGGSVTLNSPVINATALLSPGERAGISYAWFLHIVSPVAGDPLRVLVSVSGAAGPFVEVASHIQSGTHWRRAYISAAELASLGVTLTSQTVLRFVAIDANPQSVVEAAVDDVRIVGDCATTQCPGDITRSGSTDTDDLLALLGSWGTCLSSLCPADIYPAGGDGAVNTDDLLTILGDWGPCP